MIQATKSGGFAERGGCCWCFKFKEF